MAPRPDLYPLQTPRNITFPSELQEYIKATSNPEPTKQNNGKGPSVPPPLAYTEFLKALSPAFGSPQSANTPSSSWTHGKQLPSPISVPSTASTLSFPGDITRSRTRSYSYSHSPLNGPRSAVELGPIRRVRLSPTFLYSAASDSPKSAQPIRSSHLPIKQTVQYVESPTSANGKSICIQHVITHTVTLKRVPSLNPPPKGKRRKLNQAQKK